MIEIDFSLWNQFANSGKVADYLAYKMTSQQISEEQNNADYDRGYCNS